MLVVCYLYLYIIRNKTKKQNNVTTTLLVYVCDCLWVICLGWVVLWDVCFTIGMNQLHFTAAAAAAGPEHFKKVVSPYAPLALNLVCMQFSV